MKKSTILTCFSAIGVVGTAILAAKEAPKAAKLCEMEEKQRQGYIVVGIVESCWGCKAYLLTPYEAKREGFRK